MKPCVTHLSSIFLESHIKTPVTWVKKKKKLQKCAIHTSLYSDTFNAPSRCPVIPLKSIIGGVLRIIFFFHLKLHDSENKISGLVFTRDIFRTGSVQRWWSVLLILV